MRGHKSFGSSVNKIEAPFDTAKSLVKSVHSLVHSAHKGQNLSLHLFKGRYPAFDIGEIELNPVDSPPDVAQVLKHDVVRFVRHNANLVQYAHKSYALVIPPRRRR